MTKRKKLAKRALKHPDMFSVGELAFFQKWLEEHKRVKAEEKASRKEQGRVTEQNSET